MTLLPRFGITVRQLRQARGWSQERLAERAELDRSYMGEIERSHVTPSLATAAKLAAALELPLSQLISQAERAMDGDSRLIAQQAAQKNPA